MPGTPLDQSFKLDFNFGGNAEFLVKIENLLERIDSRFGSVEDTINETSEATDEMAESVDELNDAFKRGEGSLSRFGERLKEIASYYISFQAAKMGAERVWSFGMESMDAFSTQERAENQLKGVLQNRGSIEQFDAIKAYAGDIQSRGIYGDEAMIKGAGELATYVKGTESLKAMMDLLTNYAAGMTGGGEVSPEQMESLATGLGMAYDGNYMAMRRKGFDTSKLEALDAIVENGGVWEAKEKQKYGDVLDAELLREIKAAGGVTEEMRVAALKESLADWDKLYDSVNNLDSSAIIKFNNKLGDLRENIGQKIYPTFNKLVATIDEHMPDIEEMFEAIGGVFESIADTIRENIGNLIDLGKWLADGIPKLVSLGSTILNTIGKVTDLTGAFKMLMIYLAANKVYDFTNAIAGGENGGLFGALGKITGAINGEEGLVGALGNFSKSAAGAQVALVGITWGLEKLWELGNAISDLGDARKEEKANKDKAKARDNAYNQIIAAKRNLREGKITEDEYKKKYDAINGFFSGNLKGSTYDIWSAADAAKKEQQKSKGTVYQQFNTTNIEQKVNVAAEVEK